MNTRQYITYIVFTKRGKGVSKIVGPVFEKEINRVREQEFEEDEKVHIMEEGAFSGMYSNRYLKHIQQNWRDKVYCYFVTHGHWVGATQSVRLVDEEKNINRQGYLGDWFNMYEFIDSRDNKKKIEVNFHIDANQFYTARLLLDLRKLLPMPVLQGKTFFEGSDRKIYTGSKANSRSLAEKYIENQFTN